MRTRDEVFELFLNYACQAKCAFCYNPPITDELLRRELSFEQAAAALYQASEAGATRLNLHGGEVTLRDDLPKILRLAKKLGFQDITLVTNGIRLSEGPYLRSVLKAGLTHVRFSIHGHDSKSHDAIVEVPGAFGRILKAIESLKEAKIPVGINFVLVRDNVALLPALLERFVVKGGLDDVIVYFPHERGMMAFNADRIAVPYSAARPALLKSAALLDEAGKLSSLLIANVPPCALPELADLLLDWEREPGEAGSAMIGPEGKVSDLEAMKDAQREAAAACGACALKDRCRGVEPEYLRRRGDAEFRALAAVPPALAAEARR